VRRAGERVPDIPLEPVLACDGNLPSAAAGSERDLPPASPGPEGAYSPPLVAGEWWAGEEQRAKDRGPMVLRLSPLETPPFLSVPTGIGEEAVGLAPAGVETPLLALPGSLMGMEVPSAVRLPTVESEGAVGLAPAGVETPPPILVGHPGRCKTVQLSDMIEEAATVACILQKPDLVDMLQGPGMSIFSPPAPASQVKPEPVEVVEIPDTPPRVCASPAEAPIDYRQAYEDLRQRFRGHTTQLHFWAEIVGALGTEGSRAPTPQEQARRQQLITLGYWPAWMLDIVDVPLSELGERFRIYYGALLHDGAPGSK